MSQADSSGLQRASSLSPDAAEFVPSSSGQGPFQGAGGQPSPMNKVPSYLTTCYPFVQMDQPPCNVNNYRWQNPGPTKHVVGGKAPRPVAPQAGLLRTPWAAMTPVSLPYMGMAGVSTAGIPFDGGTTAGDGLLPTPSVYPYPYPPMSYLPGPMAGGVGVEMYGGVRTTPTTKVAPKGQGKQGRHDSGGRVKASSGSKRASESDHRPHTMIVKDVSCQTDFSEEFADLTLSERPNLLFQPRPRSMRSKGSQRNISSDSEVDSDSGYSSPLIRRNLISNGTQPAGSFALSQSSAVRASVAATSPQCSVVPPHTHSSSPLSTNTNTHASASHVPSANTNMHANAPQVPLKPPEVPAPVTYAMMAQMKRTATAQTPTAQTSSNQSKSLSGTPSQGSGTIPKSVGMCAGGQMSPQYCQESVGKSVSVAMSRTTGAKPLQQYCGVSGALKGPVNSGHREVVESGVVVGSQVAGHVPFPEKLTADYPSLRSQSTSSAGMQQGTSTSPGLQPLEAKSYSQVAAAGRSWPSEHPRPQNPVSPAPTANALAGVRLGQEEEQQEKEEDGEKKRRRRRRNRHRNRQRDNEGDDPSCADSGLSRTSTEVTLHFEDEEEFPDLGSHADHGQDPHPASRSYSQALRVAPGVGSQGMVEDWPSVSNDTAWTGINVASEVKGDSWQAVGNKESKNARKRRKRREMVNQAAEEELAEIGLEQQMLLGLQNKTPPTRNAPPHNQPGTAPPPAQPAVEEGGRKGGLISHQAVVQEARTPHPPTPGKKSKTPIALDLVAMIDALEKKKEEPKKEEVKPLLVVRKDGKQGRALNALDSNAPTMKRGKERENPKPKKPSPLKKVILKEREEKKKLRMLDDDGTVLNGEGASVGVGVVNSESDLSQDGLSSKSSQEAGMGVLTSADLSPISQTSPISMSPLSPGPSPLSSGLNSPVTGLYKDTNPAVLKIHSRRFREYCTQVLDKEIDECCTTLLQDLVRFQDRIFHRDPAKAKSRRRIVLGLREVSKHLKLRKIKCVVISPNLEKIQSKGGLDEALNNIINMCRDQNIPFVFALGRRALGRACAKLVPVSVVGIFNYEGSEANYHKLIDLTQKARESYKEMLSAVEREIAEFPRLHVGTASSTPALFAHMGHSRTPSGCSVISFTSSILSEPISENYPYSEPETDSKGYEIVRHPEKASGSSTLPRAVHEIDDGNEADTEDCAETTCKVVPPAIALDPTPGGALAGEAAMAAGEEEEEEDYEDEEDVEGDEDGHSNGASDTVDELPHIDSIHTSNYDLGAEILSQHSVRTLENSEVLSTHSSRTVGDCGSATLTSDPERPRPDSMRAGSGTDNSSATGGLSSRVRLMDKDRIQSWVDASQPVLLEVPEGAGQNEDKSNDEEEKQEEEEESEGSDAYESACDGESDLDVVASGGDSRESSGEATVKSENPMS